MSPKKSVSFNDQITIVGDNNYITTVYLPDILNDNRSLFQKKLDRLRFKHNKIDKFDIIISSVLLKKIKSMEI